MCGAESDSRAAEAAICQSPKQRDAQRRAFHWLCASTHLNHAHTKDLSGLAGQKRVLTYKNAML